MSEGKRYSLREVVDAVSKSVREGPVELRRAAEVQESMPVLIARDMEEALRRIEQELNDNLSPEVRDTCRAIARSALAGHPHATPSEDA